MKTKLSILFAGLITSSAVMATTITVVNPSNKASPGTVFAKSYEQALSQNGKYDVQFYQASSCADADAKYNRTKNAVMVVNADVNIAAKSKGMACSFQATEANTTLITKSYLKICRKAGSTKEFGTERTTVGLASVILSPGLFTDLNGGNKRKLVGVPYSGSKTVLAAVLSGDIDYGIMGAGIAEPAAAKGEVDCTFDYDPAAKNYLGKTVTGLKIPTMPIINVVHTNSDDAGVKAAVASASTNKAFIASIATHGFRDTKNSGITAGDVSTVEKYINDLYTTYWKK
tara:strand:- start:3009 stop:3866 length:858 start_codon:yes stop_codon:yes gene_type:complete